MRHLDTAQLAAPTAGADEIGAEIYALAARLFPICRSITGNGVRQSLDLIARYIPLDRHEVPTGTRVFDWVVPKEWTVRGARIRDMAGRTIVDFANSNLHVLNYSIPVHRTVPLE